MYKIAVNKLQPEVPFPQLILEAKQSAKPTLEEVELKRHPSLR